MTSVRVDVADRIATVLVDRADALNAIDEDVLGGLEAALEVVAARDDVRGVLLRTAGDRAFCVGLDLDLLGRAFDDHDYFGDVVTRFRDVLLGIEALPVPVVAVVDGLARAGGFELLLACDLVVVTADARIGDTHVAFGLLPGGGAAVRATRRLGHQRAAELLLTDRWLVGAEAVAAGLAVESAPRDRLDEVLERLCARIRPLPAAALAATKHAMTSTADLDHRAAIDEELRQFRAYLDREPLHREGYDAFVQRRPPAWSA